MSVWLLAPRDPFIARDGRPAGVGGRLTTLPFPFPSTLAGAVRTRMVAGDGPFDLTAAEADELLRLEVAGPLLAALDDAGDVADWLAPAPRDAQPVMAEDGSTRLLQLRPARRPAAGGMNLPEPLLPVMTATSAAGKPPDKVPIFWRWKELERWLLAPGDRERVDLEDLGLPALPVEARTHVAIHRHSRVGIDGALFQTSGLRFLAKGPAALAPRSLALAVRCTEGTVAGRQARLAERFAPLGGERRLARWTPAGQGWPELPAAVRKRIADTGRSRLVLLTPAVFEAGALPAWSGAGLPGWSGVRATVRAACTGRAQVVSGWALAPRGSAGPAGGQPKPTRRLAPAGSVYFLELAGTRAEREAWCDAVWLSTVSDDLADRRDGFGLAALGTWEDAP